MRETWPVLPYYASSRGNRMNRRMPWRAASSGARWLSPSTARVTVMCGRTTTSSMGRTGRSSDRGVLAICSGELLPVHGHSQSGRRTRLAAAPREAHLAPSRNGVDGHGGQQHEAGDDEDPLHVQAL